jgi:signal peptidase II
VIYTLVVLLAVVLDQLTKLWILRSFELYESREIIPGLFNLVYVTNTGAAFSFLADIDSPWRHHFFLGVGLLATIGLTLYYYRLRAVHRGYAIALDLVVGGALGNLIDRLRLGSVVDFLTFTWPATTGRPSMSPIRPSVSERCSFSSSVLSRNEKTVRTNS